MTHNLVTISDEDRVWMDVVAKAFREELQEENEQETQIAIMQGLALRPRSRQLLCYAHLHIISLNKVFGNIDDRVRDAYSKTVHQMAYTCESIADYQQAEEHFLAYAKAVLGEGSKYKDVEKQMEAVQYLLILQVRGKAEKWALCHLKFVTNFGNHTNNDVEGNNRHVKRGSKPGGGAINNQYVLPLSLSSSVDQTGSAAVCFSTEKAKRNQHKMQVEKTKQLKVLLEDAHIAIIK